MKLSLDEMATFVHVVNSGSYTRASRRTGIPVSTISRHISELEKRLNVQLLYRTSRQQRLTDTGEIYFEHCSQMLANAETAELAVQNLQAEPSGTLRITLPYVFEDPFASNFMTSFLTRYPKLNVDFRVNQRKVDLIEEGYDCAVVPGFPDDSSLKSRGLGNLKVIYCASPGYLEKNGEPTKENLTKHQAVIIDYPSWFNLPKDPISEHLKGRLTTNDIVVARRSAVGGLGIACLPVVNIATQLKNKQLIEVLNEFAFSVPFSLLFPSNKRFTAKLRAYIDHMVEFASRHSPWEV